MTRQREIRTFKLDVDSGTKPSRIVGYAAVFNQVAHGEMIAPGAFTKTLAEQADIRAYWSHDANGSQVLGRTTNGTLTLREDDKGLWCEISPNLQTEWGRSALASVARGDVNQMSFGFAPVRESYEDIGGARVRVLKEVRLYEVSPVAEPWYPSTEAGVRGKHTGCNTPSPEPSLAGHSTTVREAFIRGIEIESIMEYAK
jgi:uncharacterized protein